MKSDGVRSLEGNNVIETPTISMFSVIFSTEHLRSVRPSELDSITFIDLSVLQKDP